MELGIERLTESDLGDALALSTAIGWNQTYPDWQRLLELCPGACFGGHVDGELVATSTLATYGTQIGWIGMVLVDPDHRRRGYGSAVFERALNAGLDAGIDVIGLDATGAGRRVYDDHEFERIGGIDRFRGELETPDDWNAAGTTTVSDAEAAAAFDAACCGVERRDLLAHLMGSEGVTSLRVPADGPPGGLAFVRPGRECPQVGPVVGTELETLKMLLATIDDRIEGEILVDALDSDRFSEVLSTAGLTANRSLHRMTYEGATPALDGSDVVAATGFEWG